MNFYKFLFFFSVFVKKAKILTIITAWNKSIIRSIWPSLHKRIIWHYFHEDNPKQSDGKLTLYRTMCIVFRPHGKVFEMSGMKDKTGIAHFKYIISIQACMREGFTRQRRCFNKHRLRQEYRTCDNICHSLQDTVSFQTLLTRLWLSTLSQSLF